MPLINITRMDLLKTQAAVALSELVRRDLYDATGEFGQERFACRSRLREIQKEVEALGTSWDSFYSGLVAEVQIYESERVDDDTI